MSDQWLDKLARWEKHGAIWRTKCLSEEAAVVELLTCHGEPVDELRSSDPELLAYLAARPSSEDPQSPVSSALALGRFDGRGQSLQGS